MLGPPELELLSGTTLGTLGHRLRPWGLVPRPRGLTGLAGCWGIGREPERRSPSNLEAERLMEGGPRALGRSRWALEMVRGAVEEWVQGLMQVTGMALGVLGRCWPVRQLTGEIRGLLREWGQGARQGIRTA